LLPEDLILGTNQNNRVHTLRQSTSSGGRDFKCDGHRPPLQGRHRRGARDGYLTEFFFAFSAFFCG